MGTHSFGTYWREAVNCYTADQLQMIQGFECQYDSVCSFTGPKQACCGGPVVSTPDWHFQGFRSISLGGGGTLYLHMS